MRHLRTCTLLRCWRGWNPAGNRTGGRLIRPARSGGLSQGIRRAVKNVPRFVRPARQPPQLRESDLPIKRNFEDAAMPALYGGVGNRGMAQHLHLSAPEFAAWNAAVARVAVAAEPVAIGDALTDALKVVLDFNGFFVAALHRDAPPSVPYYNDPAEPELKYHDGPYLLDPFYNHFLAGGADGCYRLAELAPEGFLRSEYFASYYHLLDFSDELGLLVRLGPNACAHVSITRRHGRPRF